MPLRIHAGGIVWHGPYLHVAATTKGFFTCRLDDLFRVPGRGPASTTPLRAARPVHLPGRDRRGARAAALLLHVARPRGVATGGGGGRVRPRRPDQAAGALPDRPGDPAPRDRRRRRGPPGRTRRRRRSDAGRGGRPGPFPPHRLARPADAGFGVRRPSRARSDATGGRRRWGPRTSPTGPRPTCCGQSASTRAGGGSSRCGGPGSTSRAAGTGREMDNGPGPLLAEATRTVSVVLGLDQRRLRLLVRAPLVSLVDWTLATYFVNAPPFLSAFENDARPFLRVLVPAGLQLAVDDLEQLHGRAVGLLGRDDRQPVGLATVVLAGELGDDARSCHRCPSSRPE